MPENSAGKDQRINPNEPISKADFIAAFLVLGSEYPDDEEFQSMIISNIDWANGLGDDDIIEWEKINGRTIPYVSRKLRIPKELTNNDGEYFGTNL